MNLEIISTNETPKNWNSNLDYSKNSSVYQTIEYSNYAKKYLKWNPIYLSIYDSKGKLVSKLLCYESKRNFNGIPLNKFLNFSKKSKVLNWMMGPIIFETYLAENIISEFIHYVKTNYSRFNGSFHPLIDYDFSKHAELTKWGTFLIDLTKSENQIELNFDKHSVIKNIKRSKERNVEIFEINEKNIFDYASLLIQFRKDNQLSEYSMEQVVELWKILKPTSFSGFIAYFKEKPIGGLLFSAFNGYINEWGVARSKLDYQERLYSQDYIKSKIINWGIKNNKKYYDLTGFNPKPISDKEKGIMRYKKKWGGKYYDLFYYKH